MIIWSLVTINGQFNDLARGHPNCPCRLKSNCGCIWHASKPDLVLNKKVYKAALFINQVISKNNISYAVEKTVSRAHEPPIN